MIDRPSRDLVEKLMVRLLNGDLTNHQLEDLWPQKSEDPLIIELPDLLWSFYSDFPEKILDPQQFANDHGPFLDRVLRFVRSDLEYQWPPHPRRNFADLFKEFLTGKSGAFDERLGAFATSGNLELWPFINVAEYEALK